MVTINYNVYEDVKLELLSYENGSIYKHAMSHYKDT